MSEEGQGRSDGIETGQPQGKLTQVIDTADLPIYTLAATALRGKGKGQFDVRPAPDQVGDDGNPLDETHRRIILGTGGNVGFFDAVVGKIRGIRDGYVADGYKQTTIDALLPDEAGPAVGLVEADIAKRTLEGQSGSRLPAGELTQRWKAFQATTKTL